MDKDRQGVQYRFSIYLEQRLAEATEKKDVLNQTSTRENISQNFLGLEWQFNPVKAEPNPPRHCPL